MGKYVDLPGVKTWYEVEGAGDPLVLLHGGMVTNELWGAQRAAFGAGFQVFLPERRAHGHSPDVEGPLTYEDMAADTIDFLTTVVGGPAHLVGWSDGGNVALLVAIARPDLVRKQVVVGANFRPASELGDMAEMTASLTPDNPDLAMFRGMYEAASPDGPEHWAQVIPRLMEMWLTGPTISEAELGGITAPTLVVSGDDDVISLEHTVAMYRAIPNSELAVVPGTSHAALMEKPELANKIILDFINNDPIPTMMPQRRAPADTH
jgi:pimeloyl-ACP methyl ester carboxylesterase